MTGAGSVHGDVEDCQKELSGRSAMSANARTYRISQRSGRVAPHPTLGQSDDDQGDR